MTKIIEQRTVPIQRPLTWYYCICFTQRKVGMWNELPEVAVETGTKSTYKMHLDQYMARKGLGGICVKCWQMSSLDGAWTSWAKGPVFVMFDSDSLSTCQMSGLFPRICAIWYVAKQITKTNMCLKI